MSRVDADELRGTFAAALSAMYRAEVPLYGTLLEIVARTNADARAASASGDDDPDDADDRLAVERHGAIRLATPEELATMRRVFGVMGMEPVGYYDLAPSGLPVHSTAFRPIDRNALRRNPFRVFTSLVRLDTIADTALRDEAQRVVRERSIFSPRLLDLTALAETDGLHPNDAQAFVTEALETFRWHREARVSAAFYRRLHDAHPLFADVVAFAGPHVNHLTPRTLDIDAAQRAMREHGLPTKTFIEGPPARRHPILLRQTSFHAVEEPIVFPGDDERGAHAARFGEIEQRGAALTRTGRALYDRLLAHAQDDARADRSPGARERHLRARFAAFPDDLETLVADDLIFVRPSADGGPPRPILYEDFLPVSATGIFRSNLGDDGRSLTTTAGSRARFEAHLGATVHDEFALYDAQARQSSPR